MREDEHRPPRRRKAAWWFVVLVLAVSVASAGAFALNGDRNGRTLHGQGRTGFGDVEAPRTPATEPAVTGPARPATAGPVTTTDSTSSIGSTGLTGAAGVPHGAMGCRRECHGHGFGVRVTSVAGLYPGSSARLPVRYLNPHAFAITVTSATVTATSRTRGCAGSYVVTGTYPTRTAVDAHGETSTTLPFGLRTTAPDACQGARWSITVTARGEKR